MSINIESSAGVSPSLSQQDLTVKDKPHDTSQLFGRILECWNIRMQRERNILKDSLLKKSHNLTRLKKILLNHNSYQFISEDRKNVSEFEKRVRCEEALRCGYWLNQLEQGNYLGVLASITKSMDIHDPGMRSDELEKEITELEDFYSTIHSKKEETPPESRDSHTLTKIYRTAFLYLCLMNNEPLKAVKRLKDSVLYPEEIQGITEVYDGLLKASEGSRPLFDTCVKTYQIRILKNLKKLLSKSTGFPNIPERGASKIRKAISEIKNIAYQRI